jgi:hypothetical protein
MGIDEVEVGVACHEFGSGHRRYVIPQHRQVVLIYSAVAVYIAVSDEKFGKISRFIRVSGG